MSSTQETLADLSVGFQAVVAEVGGERPTARRLMEMGVLPGTRVAVVRVAPLGDPIEIEVRGYSLSIRRREAAAITVREVRAPARATAAERTAL